MRNYVEKINTSIDVLILSLYVAFKDLFKWSLAIVVQTIGLFLSVLGLLPEKMHEHNKFSIEMLKLLAKGMGDIKNAIDNKD